MKVYGVYTTDFWESTDSIQQQGLFSTIDLALDILPIAKARGF